MIVAKHQSIYKNAAFTLVELSIVLVIIGLVIGGVLVAQQLIETAKIRAQINQIKEFESGYETFRLKYDCMPGDCATASLHFSGTFDGDGDGIVSCDDAGGGFDGANSFNGAGECSGFFYHLSLAGFTSKKYDGSRSFGSGYPAISMYEGKGVGASYAAFLFWPGYSLHQLSQSEQLTTHSAALYFSISQPSLLASDQYDNDLGVFSPLEAYQLDSKIDDGVARSGLFKAYTVRSSDVGNCLDGVDGDYLFTNNQVACQAEYILD